MKASEVIERLKSLIDSYGDREVIFYSSGFHDTEKIEFVEFFRGSDVPEGEPDLDSFCLYMQKDINK